MNVTTVNSTIISCGLAFFPMVHPENISPDLRVVFSIRIAFNALTCPLIIVLNIMVMVAVKTKRQLRTKSNIALACLSTTDLAVGLLVQPFHIIHASFLLIGQRNIFCNLIKSTTTLTTKCLTASFTHLVLLSAERYVAVRHPFTHENQVTEVRIIIASTLSWVTVLLFPTEEPSKPKPDFMKTFIVFIAVPALLCFPAMIYFNCVVYKEVRRSEKQIAANQISLEAKEKILKNKKAFYTTVVVLLAAFLCYIPINIFLVIFASNTERESSDGGETAIFLLPLISVLNSLFNPLIYAVRIRHFRLAFIQLLTRKSIAQAEEVYRKIFGPRQIRVTANVEQGNETLNNGHDTTVQTQPQVELEETAL